MAVPRSGAYADGLEIGFLNIEHDADTNVLHIVHRFFQQDVEIAFSRIAGQSVTLKDNTIAERVVRPYLQDRFSLSALDGTPLEAQWVDVEQRDGTLLIRQQSRLPAAAPGLVIRNALLLDTHPRYVNILHATIGGETFKRDFMSGGITQKLLIDETKRK